MGSWYMNSDGNETDRSGEGMTLTETGGDNIPTSADVPPGYAGTSREFNDGEDEGLVITDAAIGDGTKLDINGAGAKITICIWVKHDIASPADHEYYVAKEDQYETKGHPFLIYCS